MPAARVHVIPHGAFDYLARMPEGPPPARARRRSKDASVVLFFGLMRPYKGVDLLSRRSPARPTTSCCWSWGCRACRSSRSSAASRELGIADRVRFVPRFVPDAEVPAYFRRADVAVLPYREIEQSGVLYTALAFGTPMLLSEVGGFPEIARARRCAAGRAGQRGVARAWRSPACSTTSRRGEQLSQAALALAAGHTPGSARPSSPRSCTASWWRSGRMTAVAVIFWVSLALIVYTHVGYPLLLRALVALRSARRAGGAHRHPQREPDRRGARRGRRDRARRSRTCSRSTIAASVRADRRLGRVDRSTRSSCATAVAQCATVKVLDLPRRGKVHAQDAAVDVATRRDPRLLRRQRVLGARTRCASWSRAVRGPARGLRVRAALLPDADGSNQEGAYWRFENWLRALESRIGSVTAGNGAIYAVRREAYMRLDPRTSHDLSFPFNLVKKGWKALYEPAARAIERPVPSIEGEFRAQAAHDESRLADGAVGRHAEPARLRGHVRVRDRLAPRAALRDPVPARGSRWRATSCCSARAGSTRSRSRSSSR